MFGIIAAVSTLVAEVSGAIATASVPMLGGIVAAGAKGIGTAVGTAVANAGGSAIAGTLAANSAQTVINGAAIGIAKGNFD